MRTLPADGYREGVHELRLARDFGAGQPATGELGQLLQFYRPVLLSGPASAAVVDVALAAVEVTARACS
ncbi:hypothetical protein [Streptomyces scopuliridis]|uniref:hypothetical protein n=1 Tax=Streptomyces scopuliridis TaxID=452529 RepID=UPI0036A11EAE